MIIELLLAFTSSPYSKLITRGLWVISLTGAMIITLINKNYINSFKEGLSR